MIIYLKILRCKQMFVILSAILIFVTVPFYSHGEDENPMVEDFIMTYTVPLNIDCDNDYFDCDSGIFTYNLLSSTWDLSIIHKVQFKIIENKADDDTGKLKICNVVLLPGQVLQINKGVDVEFGSEFKLIVQGGLLVNGTEKQMVNFKVGGGIEFNSQSSYSEIKYCKITQGDSYFGGGVFANGFSKLLIENCTISGNKAVYGGGIYLENGSNLTIKNSVIDGNSGSIYGAGLACINSSPVLKNNTIKNNKDSRFGGGVYLLNSNPVFKNNIVCNNSAIYGGGGYLESSSPLIVNNIICNNASTEAGGGLYFKNSNSSVSSSLICNNLSNGKGGGAYLEVSTPQFDNSVLYKNAVSPFDNSDDQTPEQVYIASGSMPGFNYCYIENGKEGFTGIGFNGSYVSDIDGDSDPSGQSDGNAGPGFSAPSSAAGLDGSGADADWSLKFNSPCINKGTYDPQFSSEDIIGNERPYNKSMRGKYSYDEIFTDIGAYEFQNNPPFMGNSANDVDHLFEYVKEGELLVITLAQGFDVDGNEVHTIIDTEPEMDGKLYQYKADGEQLELIDRKGDAISRDKIIEDSKGRVIYEPPDVEELTLDRFICRVSDGTNVSPNSETINISVTSVENKERELPSYNQKKDIESLGMVNDETAAENLDKIIDSIKELSSLELDDQQKNMVLNGMRSVSKVEDLTQDQKLALLDAMEQLCVNNPDDKANLLSDKQSSQLIDILSRSAENKGMTSEEIKKHAEIIDQLIQQKGGVDNLSPKLKSQIDALTDLLIECSEEIGFDIESPGTGGNNFQTYLDSKKTISLISDSPVEYEEREKPTIEQQKEMDDLGKMDDATIAQYPDKIISSIKNLSSLELNEKNKDIVLTSIESALKIEDLTEDQTAELLGAMDQLCINNPDDEVNLFSDTQSSQFVSMLNQAALKQSLTKEGIQKIAEIIDDLINQSGGIDNLSPELRAQIDGVIEALMARSEEIGFDINSPGTGGNNFQTFLYLKKENLLNKDAPLADIILDSVYNLSLKDINQDEIDTVLSGLDDFLEKESVSAMDAEKIIEILNKLITKDQLGTIDLSSTQIAQIHEAMGKVADKVASSVTKLNINQFEYLKLTINQIDLSLEDGSIEVGDIAKGEANIVCSEKLLNELKTELGVEKIKLCIITEKVTNIVAGLLVTAYFTDLDANVLYVKDLVNPLRLSIPLSDENIPIPKWHDASQGIWSMEGISDIDTSVNWRVSFGVDHLTCFALFGSTEQEKKDKGVSDTNTGSSSCFINTLL